MPQGKPKIKNHLIQWLLDIKSKALSSNKILKMSNAHWYEFYKAQRFDTKFKVTSVKQMSFYLSSIALQLSEDPIFRYIILYVQISVAVETKQ